MHALVVGATVTCVVVALRFSGARRQGLQDMRQLNPARQLSVSKDFVCGGCRAGAHSNELHLLEERRQGEGGQLTMKAKSVAIATQRPPIMGRLSRARVVGLRKSVG